MKMSIASSPILEFSKEQGDVIKSLKYGTFVWCERKRKFYIWLTDKKTGEKYVAEFDKVYAFALMRFIIRISQRNWFRKKKK